MPSHLERVEGDRVGDGDGACVRHDANHREAAVFELLILEHLQLLRIGSDRGNTEVTSVLVGGVFVLPDHLRQRNGTSLDFPDAACDSDREGMHLESPDGQDHLPDARRRNLRNPRSVSSRSQARANKEESFTSATDLLSSGHSDINRQHYQSVQ